MRNKRPKAAKIPTQLCADRKSLVAENLYRVSAGGAGGFGRSLGSSMQHSIIDESTAFALQNRLRSVNPQTGHNSKIGRFCPDCRKLADSRPLGRLPASTKGRHGLTE